MSLPIPKRKRGREPPAASPSRTEQLARVIEQTGDEVDVELAALLRRHPLPWKLDTGLSIGTLPAIRRTHPRRANERYYEAFSSDDIRTLARVAGRYATMIEDSELPARKGSPSGRALKPAPSSDKVHP